MVIARKGKTTAVCRVGITIVASVIPLITVTMQHPFCRDVTRLASMHTYIRPG